MLTTMRNINIAPDTGVKKPTRKARSFYDGPYMTFNFGINPRYWCVLSRSKAKATRSFVLFTRNSIE